MKFSTSGQHWLPGTYVYVDRKGNKTIRYYDGEEFVFNHTARKPPTKHLLIYKYTKKIINKLIHFIDSKFFYERSALYENRE